MSLAEKWEEFRQQYAIKYSKTNPSAFQWARLREAFYAGAEAGREEQLKREAEIDRFRSEK